MIINSETVELAFKGFKTVYSEAYLSAPVNWDKIAMKVNSSSRDEAYGWLGQLPKLREWIGGRHVKNLKAYGFTITNRKFESTVSVKRDDLADDRLGIFKPAFSEMGYLAKMHPEELVMGLLKDGFTKTCFDGQYFFDADHPITDNEGTASSVSNLQAGSSTPWFLLDTSRGIKPLIWQERESYEFQSMTDPGNEYVFKNDEYLYGVRARVNAGYGLWQLAYGSKADLTAANYAAARAAMMDFRDESGRVLGVRPTVLVVPPSLEDKALRILNTENESGGGTNPWKGTAELIVSPYVA